MTYRFCPRTKRNILSDNEEDTTDTLIKGAIDVVKGAGRASGLYKDKPFQLSTPAIVGIATVVAIIGVAGIYIFKH